MIYNFETLKMECGTTSWTLNQYDLKVVISFGFIYLMWYTKSSYDSWNVNHIAINW
jgi:hypothetical protein